MKKLVFSLFFIAVTLIAICQDNANIKALIAGYKPNDTIRISDCSKLSEISLNNKGYSVVSFTLLFTDNGYDFEYVSSSNKFTNEMKSALSKLILKDNGIKNMIIKDINVQSSQNKKVKIENLIYKLKM
jgi:hypothetical protein